MRRIVPVPLFMALLALVLLAASSASAGVLCKTNESGCIAENVIEKGEGLWLSASKAVFTTNLTTVTCKTSGYLVSMTETGGVGKPAEGTSLPFFMECQTAGAGSCTISSVNSPLMKFEGTGGNGSMTVSSETKLTVQCASPSINCTFSAKEIGYEFTGGNPAVAVKENASLAFSGAVCPATGSLHSEVKSSTPASLFIVGGSAPPPPVRLCKQNLSICTVAQRYAIGTVIEGALEGNYDTHDAVDRRNQRDDLQKMRRGRLRRPSPGAAF